MGSNIDKPVIYLAGPINGCSDSEASNWRKKAVELLGDFAIFSDPMERDYRGSEGENAKKIVAEDLESVCGASALLVNPWKPSVGTAMEVMYASSVLNRPVVIVANDSLSPWYVANSTHVAASMEDAADWLRELFG
jgi:nucleoside 2-deoxyribosyltransferase